MKVRQGKREDSRAFLGLVDALAAYEKLGPPTRAGKARLVRDIFDRKKVRLLVAEDGKKLVGYALYFFTYSSFLAKPTLYLEDLFVLESERGLGAGKALFRECVRLARKNGCGRMEWAVLTWNSPAIRFYEGMKAKRLSDWYVYRLDERAIDGISRA